MEITLVGMYAETSPSSVSITGSAGERPAGARHHADFVIGLFELFEIVLGLVLAGDTDVGLVDDAGLDILGGVLGHDHVAVGQLARTLQQAAMQIKHVAGVGLAAGRAAQQQRKLPVSGRLLGQVVVDAQRVPCPLRT